MGYSTNPLSPYVVLAHLLSWSGLAVLSWYQFQDQIQLQELRELTAGYRQGGSWQFKTEEQSGIPPSPDKSATGVSPSTPRPESEVVVGGTSVTHWWLIGATLFTLMFVLVVLAGCFWCRQVTATRAADSSPVERQRDLAKRQLAEVRLGRRVDMPSLSMMWVVPDCGTKDGFWSG